jgi:hypothetical protein
VTAVLQDVDWPAVVAALVGDGWVRLSEVVHGRACTRYLAPAPTAWAALESVEGKPVRQEGFHCGASFADAGDDVRALGAAIRDGINSCTHCEIPAVPAFDEVEWSRMGFITAHRDPPGVGGVIAIVTLSGSAPFRIWPGDADPRADATVPRSAEWLRRTATSCSYAAPAGPPMTLGAPCTRSTNRSPAIVPS